MIAFIRDIYLLLKTVLFIKIMIQLSEKNLLNIQINYEKFKILNLLRNVYASYIEL